MKPTRFLPALCVTSLAALLVLHSTNARAFVIAGSWLPLSQRDFRVFNNFSDVTANDNQTGDPNFPGFRGATLAIWKGVAEWGSQLHGVGDGDPHQPGDLGSGGANFDSILQGLATSPGSPSDNTFSELAGSNGGVLAFLESSPSGGWRARFYEVWNWQDGPGTAMPSGEFDLQGVACRLTGFALGLGNSSVSGATMSSTVGNLVDLRSIEADDQAGVQAIYGVASANKPRVSGYTINGNQIQINGANFAATGNRVWFTPSGAGGASLLLNVSSSGSSLSATLPAGAGSGDVLVQVPGNAFNRLSNAWPVDLSGTTSCPAPQIYCSSLPNSRGATGSLSWSGTASILGSDDLRLLAFNAPAQKPGLFFFGRLQASLAFGNGVLCVSGALGRLGVLVTDAGGNARARVDLQSPPFQGAGSSTSIGNTLNFQFWFRDPGAGGASFNTTDGLAVEVCP